MLLNSRLKQTHMATLTHPFLQEGVEARAYQLICAKSAIRQSSLMVLPTGFGKTAVQWMVMANELQKGEKKILLIAPTTGLVDQQVKMAREFIDFAPEKIVAYTGDSKPSARTEIWENSRIIIATPQVIRNDHYASRIDITEVGTLILDEVHHCKGNHAYGQVGDIFVNESPQTRILGASASPGTKKDEIDHMMIRLGMSKLTFFEREDPLLKPFKSDLIVQEIQIRLTDRMLQILAPVERLRNNLAEQLRRNGFLSPSGYITALALDSAQKSASMAIRKGDKRGYNAAKTVSDLRRLHLLIEMIKCQGTKTAERFLSRSIGKAKSGDKSLERFSKYQEIRDVSEILKGLEELHSKPEIVLQSVKDTIDSSPSSKIIIFAEYRDTVEHLVEFLSENGIKARPFIGQNSTKERKGMTSREQIAQLTDFRNGKFEVLVATSVGEEGLDIPSSDLVIFYEPVTSAIRMIQRRGRTGRKDAGEVKVLVSLGTKEEMIKKSSIQKEKRMNSILQRVKSQLKISNSNPSFSKLEDFSVTFEDSSMSCDEFIRLKERGIKGSEVTSTNPQDIESKKPITSGARREISSENKRPSSQTGLFQFAEKETEQKKISISKSSEIKPKRHSNFENGPILDAHSLAIGSAVKMANEDVLSIPQEHSILEVTVDYREASSTLCSEMKRIGCKFRLGHLATGDVRIGPRILIERKTARDLNQSIVDGRLLSQIRRLQNSSPRPILVLEIGTGNDIGVHRNSTLGALAHIALEYGLPIIPTLDSAETARLLSIISKKELDLVNRIYQDCKDSADRKMSISGLNPTDSLDLSKWQKVCVEAAEKIIQEQIDSSSKITQWSEQRERTQVKILASIDGINQNQAKKLVSELGGIHQLMVAKPEQISAITGLSKIECMKIISLIQP